MHNITAVRQHHLACKRCGRAMHRVAEIAPFGEGPGLVAFLCTDCGTVDSALVYPQTPRQMAGTPRVA